MHLPDDEGSLGQSESDVQEVEDWAGDGAGAQEEVVTIVAIINTRSFILLFYAPSDTRAALILSVRPRLRPSKTCFRYVLAFYYFNPQSSSGSIRWGWSHMLANASLSTPYQTKWHWLKHRIASLLWPSGVNQTTRYCWVVMFQIPSSSSHPIVMFYRWFPFQSLVMHALHW